MHTTRHAAIAAMAWALLGAQPAAALDLDGYNLNPFKPAAPGDWVSIVAGRHHTCALRADNELFCWGRHDRGQVGVNLAAARCGTAKDPSTCFPQPQRVTVAVKLRQVTAGGQHTCAIDLKNQPWCWGDGISGKVGSARLARYDPTGFEFEPTLVQGGLRLHRIEAGETATCGLNLNALYCWGHLGTAFPTHEYAPFQVMPNPGYADLAVGTGVQCVLSGGFMKRVVECLGSNLVGQAGLSPSVGTLLYGLTATDFWVSTLRIVSRGEQGVTCADAWSGRPVVLCTGDNQAGALGDGTYRTSFIPQAVSTWAPLHGVSVGYRHVCALDDAGMPWCWGDGSQGQLGQGQAMGSTVPTPAAVSVALRAVAAGQHHTCGIGVDNAIYCWGDNAHGQLGTGRPGGAALTAVRVSLDGVAKP